MFEYHCVSVSVSITSIIMVNDEPIYTYIMSYGEFFRYNIQFVCLRKCVLWVRTSQDMIANNIMEMSNKNIHTHTHTCIHIAHSEIRRHIIPRAQYHKIVFSHDSHSLLLQVPTGVTHTHELGYVHANSHKPSNYYADGRCMYIILYTIMIDN